jgi:hypothetical protein
MGKCRENIVDDNEYTIYFRYHDWSVSDVPQTTDDTTYKEIHKQLSYKVSNENKLSRL